MPTRRVVEKIGIHGRVEDPGRDRIHRHAVLRPLHREGPRERDHRRLAGRVSRNFAERDEAVERSNVDDPPLARFSM